MLMGDAPEGPRSEAPQRNTALLSAVVKHISDYGNFTSPHVPDATEVVSTLRAVMIMPVFEIVNESTSDETFRLVQSPGTPSSSGLLASVGK